MVSVSGIWSPVAGVTFFQRTSLTFEMGLRPAAELSPVYGRFEPYYRIAGKEFSKLTYDAVYG